MENEEERERKTSFERHRSRMRTRDVRPSHYFNFDSKNAPTGLYYYIAILRGK